MTINWILAGILKEIKMSIAASRGKAGDIRLKMMKSTLPKATKKNRVIFPKLRRSMANNCTKFHHSPFRHQSSDRESNLNEKLFGMLFCCLD